MPLFGFSAEPDTTPEGSFQLESNITSKISILNFNDQIKNQIVETVEVKKKLRISQPQK